MEKNPTKTKKTTRGRKKNKRQIKVKKNKTITINHININSLAPNNASVLNTFERTCMTATVDT